MARLAPTFWLFRDRLLTGPDRPRARALVIIISGHFFTPPSKDLITSYDCRTHSPYPFANMVLEYMRRIREDSAFAADSQRIRDDSRTDSQGFARIRGQFAMDTQVLGSSSQGPRIRGRGSRRFTAVFRR